MRGCGAGGRGGASYREARLFIPEACSLRATEARVEAESAKSCYRELLRELLQHTVGAGSVAVTSTAAHIN